MKILDIKFIKTEGARLIGAAVVSGLAAGYIGRGSPGLAGLVMFICLISVAIWATPRGNSLSKTLLWILLVNVFCVAPSRLIGVAFRELGAMTWHLEAIMHFMIVFWMTLGAACLTVRVLARPESAGSETPAQKIR